MLARPDRLESQALGEGGDLEGALPRASRLPAVVLAVEANREDDPDLHGGPTPSCDVLLWAASSAPSSQSPSGTGRAGGRARGHSARVSAPEAVCESRPFR